MIRGTGPGLGLARSSAYAAFAKGTVPLVHCLVAARVSAHAITAFALLAGVASGVALAFGDFGWATLGLLVAFVGDALDGPVARQTRTASTAGALFDASADRYQEFFALGGLALFFRTDAPVLVLVLFALMGSFMVSYGSAKAEGAHVAVPSSVMRRPERAACLWIGVALASAAGAGGSRWGLPTWIDSVPVVLAVALIAIAANLSAVRRFHAVAVAARVRQSQRVSARVPDFSRRTVRSAIAPHLTDQ